MDLAPAPDDVSPLIKAGAAVVAAEALALFGLAVFAVVELESDHVALGITNAVFFTLAAAALGFCARGLSRARRWSRSPIVMTQLIQLGVAWSFYGNETVWVAVILAVLAAAVLAVVLAPSTTQLLYGSAYDRGEDETNP